MDWKIEYHWPGWYLQLWSSINPVSRFIRCKYMVYNQRCTCMSRCDYGDAICDQTDE